MEIINKRFPFIFGAQYYRAPTPEPECWETDLRNMHDWGFNEVKFWVQWRWSHLQPDSFYWEDLDKLMDLAYAHELGVTLNIILDVAPVWLYREYPDAKQIDNTGNVFEPQAVGHRTIGGHPGPCYSHSGSLSQRVKFVEAAVCHFRSHPALHMWDVWNEPELNYFQRTPNLANIACYCDNCHAEFIEWLRRKYISLDELNRVWGRCYRGWLEIELPRGVCAVVDFVDWREFHLDILASEAKWRLDAVKALDPEHVRYLHVVPNTYFNPVTCADDFSMAEHCEVFAATMSGLPSPCIHILSAARGKTCYNVESHVNFGSADMHQRVVDLQMLLSDFLPQIGLGVKGFLFWQYRPEVLGLEAPAWGLVGLDGREREVTRVALHFWDRLKPYSQDLCEARPDKPQVGVWRSRKNEIFHFCTQGTVNNLNASIEAYINALYWDSLPCCVISGEMLADADWEDIRLLIMPSCYYLTQPEARALDLWIRGGGVLICEAHLGGYDGSAGRHSRTVPGCGLAQLWGLWEEDSTSSYHLSIEADVYESTAMSQDVRKAISEFGSTGGKFFPILCSADGSAGSVVWGSHRYTRLEGEDIEAIGSFDGLTPCIARKRVGKGTVYYCGTNLGQAAEKDVAGVRKLIGMGVASAGLKPTLSFAPEVRGSMHLDILSDKSGPRFAVAVNKTDREQAATLAARGRWTGLYSKAMWSMDGSSTITIPPKFADIFIIES